MKRLELARARDEFFAAVQEEGESVQARLVICHISLFMPCLLYNVKILSSTKHCLFSHIGYTQKSGLHMYNRIGGLY